MEITKSTFNHYYDIVALLNKFFYNSTKSSHFAFNTDIHLNPNESSIYMKNKLIIRTF